LWPPNIQFRPSCRPKKPAHHDPCGAATVLNGHVTLGTPIANPPLSGLTMRERTGSRIVHWVWSYVLVPQLIFEYIHSNQNKIQYEGIHLVSTYTNSWSGDTLSILGPGRMSSWLIILQLRLDYRTGCRKRCPRLFPDCSRINHTRDTRPARRKVVCQALLSH
jgi:hypothetical protein